MTIKDWFSEMLQMEVGQTQGQGLVVILDRYDMNKTQGTN